MAQNSVILHTSCNCVVKGSSRWVRCKGLPCAHTAVHYISQRSRILHMVLEISVMAQLAVSLSCLSQGKPGDIYGRVVSCRAGQSMETHHALAPGRFLAAEYSRASRAPGCRRMRALQLAIIYPFCILCWLEKLVLRCRSICIMLERCMLACAIKHRRRMNPFRLCLQAHPLLSKVCIAAWARQCMRRGVPAASNTHQGSGLRLPGP